MSVSERVRVAGTRFERTLLARPGAEPDTTSRVVWLQGRELYCDLRQPALLPASAEPSLLATQDGFAGRLIDRGEHVEWERTVSFHPAGANPDVGTLAVLDADTLVEHGVLEQYTEHWRITYVSQDIDEHLLTGVDSDATAVLLRVGDLFAFARGRERALGPEPLIDQIRSAATYADAGALTDCEISVGHVDDGCWTITASTIPHRIGNDLGPTFGDEIHTRDVSFDGRAATRRWRHVEPTPKGKP